MPMKRIVSVILVAIALALPAKAVVKEKNMDLTVKELHDDLQSYRTNLEYNISQYEKQRADYWAQMNKCMHECQEYTIVLYTQQENRLFGLSQACQNLEDLMDDFQKNQHPFEKWKGNFDSEIERYNRLEDLLGRIDTRTLTTKGDEARKACVEICGEIKERLTELQQQIVTNQELYESAANRMAEMAEYNANRFESIRHNVFMSGGESYFKTLGNFGKRIKAVIEDIKAGDGASTNKTTRRENWIMLLTLGLIAAVSIFLAILTITVLLPKRFRKNRIIDKKGFVIAAVACTLFVLLAYIVCHTFMSGFNILPSVDLFLYMMIIIDIFLVSVALRCKADEAMGVFRCYIPVLFTAVVFIFERLTLASNNIINLTIPPVLLISFIWQLTEMVRHGRWGERFASVMMWLTCIITGAMCLLAWFGFTFLALMLEIYWIVQLTCLQAVTCLTYVVKRDELKHAKEHGAREIWLNPTVEKLILPVFTVATFAISFRWASQMFSMRSWAENILHTNLLNAITGTVTVTLSKILILIALAFAIIWAIHMIKTALQQIYKENYTTGAIPLYITLGSIFIWFLYAVVVIKLFNIDSKGLIAAVGGLGVGLGFALKDTINDLLCGLTLLMGRVHLNDYIECDGIRGRILDVGIRSTTIDTLDGSTMSFLNSQLFAKNFKNITKSHSYELCKIPVSVSYGTDMDKAREVILKALEPHEKKFAHRDPVVMVSNFADSGVDLEVRVWLTPKEKISLMADIREKIYNAFNAEGIEIPFPQCDIHIITDNSNNGKQEA